MLLLKQSLLIILTESFIIKEIDRIRLDHENLINENWGKGKRPPISS